MVTKEYDYGPSFNHLLPIKVTTYDSDDRKYITENKYVFDYAQFEEKFGATDDEPTPVERDKSVVYEDMIQRNMIGMPIEVIQTVETSAGSDVFRKVAGSHTEFEMYDVTNTSSRGSIASESIRGVVDSAFPYPYRFYSYEVQLDGNGDPIPDQADWDVVGYAHVYDADAGRPKRFKQRGWDQEEYVWDAH